MVLALPAPWSLLLLLLFGDVDTSRLCTRRNVANNPNPDVKNAAKKKILVALIDALAVPLEEYHRR